MLGSIPSRIGWLVLRVGKAGSGRAIGPLSLWFVWQWLTTRYYRVRPVRPGGFLKYNYRTYGGAPVALADGTVVRRGDRVVEIHLNNGAVAARLRKIKGDSRTTAWTWLMVRTIPEDMAALAAPGRLPPEVKAVHGLTLLARGSRRLGFEVRSLPKTRWHDLVCFFMLGLLTIYNPEGRRRLARFERWAYPAEVWMSRRKLEERFGGG